MAKNPKTDSEPKATATVNDDYSTWLARIETAKTAREDLVEDGDKNVEHYEGKILPVGFKDTVAVNLVYVDMKQSVPEYYSQNPKIFVDPEIPGAETDALIGEKILNIKWEELKMKKVCRGAIKSTKLYGMCAFKTYFNFQENFVKDEWDDRVQNDEVRTDKVPLKYLLKDCSAPSWETSSWIAHERRMKRIDIADKFGIKKTDIAITDSDEGTADYKDSVREDFEYGTFYEVEDRRNGMLFYIVEGYDKILNAKKKTYRYDTMYDFLMYNDIPDKADPISDYKFWRPQLIELATYRSMEVSHARKGNSKYIARGKKLREEQKTQLKSSDDATVVQLDADQQVDPFQHASLDPQLFQAENACRSDIQLISKQAPRQDNGDKTATEVKAVEAASMQVSGENLERLEECMGSIANKWLMLMQDNYTSTRTVKLSGMAEAEFSAFKDKVPDNVEGTAKQPFLKFTKDNIGKKIKARIQAGSTAPNNDQARMARFQGFAAFVANANLMAGIDQEELLKEASQIFGVENDNLLLVKDNPMEESRLLNSGVFVAAKLGQNHDQHIFLHEREGNGSDENAVHILSHKMFKKQIDAMAQAQAVTAPAPQNPATGQSFMGMAPLPGDPTGGAVNALPPQAAGPMMPPNAQ